MNFADLYRFSDGLGLRLTPVERLRTLVEERHQSVGKVYFWRCALDQNVSRGHMILELERTSPYEDGYIAASIRFDQSLNVCWQRFVCCKELMHVFDSSLAKTSNKERFLRLMNELENNPISVDQSDMFKSERNAEWMALLALCPMTLREKYVERYRGRLITELQIATELRIPEVYVRPLMGDQYKRAFELLTGEANGSVMKGRSGIR